MRMWIAGAVVAGLFGTTVAAGRQATQTATAQPVGPASGE